MRRVLLLILMAVIALAVIFGCKTSERVGGHDSQKIRVPQDDTKPVQPPQPPPPLSKLENFAEPSGEICGVQDDDHKPTDYHVPKTRLAGGLKARKHSWPWHVLLKRIRRGEVVLECNAALVPVMNNREKSDILVTNAGCITGYMENVPPGRVVAKDMHSVVVDPSEFRAIPGLHHKNEHGAVEFLVNKTLPHPDFYGKPKFDKRVYYFDVAIVKLNEPMIFSKMVWPICLPDDEDDGQVPGSACVLTAFHNRTDEDQTEELKQVPVRIDTLKVCKWSAMADEQKTTFCGKPAIEGSSTDLADVGAPLSCLNKNDNRWYLQGSLLREVLRPDIPQEFLFSHMSTFSSWIKLHGNAMTSLQLEV